MGTLLVLVGWRILFVLCWPLALLALVLWPFVWLCRFRFASSASRSRHCSLSFVPCSSCRHACPATDAARPGAPPER